MHESETTLPSDDERTPAGVSFPAGRVFAGRYRIVTMLGRGGMGDVYRADDLRLGQTVALKLLDASQPHPRGEEQFVREVRLARGIAHPNVCRVYDIGEADGRQYLSMEFVDGETLRSLLRRIGRLPREKACDIARQLCAGLAAAHEQGVLHRDLKPSNIMVDGRGRVRIMDFGLAVPSDVSIHEFAGTPGYMAPEQVAGARVTERTDIYALGLVLYEIFSGARLFGVDTLDAAQREARWRVGQGDVDESIASIIGRCIHPDPAKRPASASAVAAALDGEATPAAHGDDGSLPRWAAWSALAAAIVGAFALAAYPRPFTVAASELPISPEALAERARTVLARSAAAPPIDRDFWFAPTREGARYPARFVYRQSAAYLVPRNLFHIVTEDDPAADLPGMATVVLDPQGRLGSFALVIDREAKPPAAAAPIDWARWFADAGLDEADFARADDGRAPPVTHDVRLFWRSIRDTSEVRVSAAALNGVPVFFEVADADARRSTPRNVLITGRPFGLELLLWTTIVVTFVIGSVLARRNLLSGDGDRVTARMLALLIGCGGAVFAVLRAHHVPIVLEELAFLLGVAGWILVWTLFAWLVYLAFEPHVRRRWPRLLTSATRLATGRLRDPRVGRDMLAGLLTAIAMALLLHARADLLNRPRAAILLPPALESLKSTRHLIAAVAYEVTDSVQFALGGVFLLFLFHVIVRRSWIAALLWIVVATSVNTMSVANAGGVTSLGDVFFATTIGVLMLGVVVRLGLVAAAAALVAERLLIGLPLTLDTNAWFASSSFAILGAIVAVALYGFVVSLGDRPAFGV